MTVSRLWATETTSDGPAQRQSVVAKQRVTKLIIVVVAVFAVCWLPSHVVWLWTNFFRSSWRHTYTFYYGRIAAHVLSYANSCMNPFIYAFVSSRFRREFRHALDCRHADVPAWSLGAVVGASSGADQRHNLQRNAAAMQSTSMQLRTIVVATTSRRADGAHPTSTTLLSRNVPHIERLDDGIVACWFNYNFCSSRCMYFHYFCHRRLVVHWFVIQLFDSQRGNNVYSAVSSCRCDFLYVTTKT